jgi:predicted unusual protein kinase regulating ubiquinone biosynthesis (AarF/ABC1/UbiB family)
MTSHHSKEDIKALVSSFSELPVAAASIGQVYEAYLPSTQSGQPPIRVAVKVQRPRVRQVVEQDTKMLLAIAEFLDSIPAISFLPSSSNPRSSTIPLPSRSKPTQRLINTQLVPAVREFMSRILEELDYRNEANNIVTFANLYSEGGSSSSNISSPKRKKNTTIPRVVVPEVYRDWCTENVLVMEWIDGTKLTNVRRREVVNGDDDSGNNNDNGDDDATRKENLALVKVAIDCTLHQLLVTGTLHGEVESSLFYF